MYDCVRDIDRRWIFLLMFLAVAIPILLQAQFPETATVLSRAVFAEIDKLDEGAPVLLAEVAAEADTASEDRDASEEGFLPSCPHCGSRRVEHLQERCRGPGP